jgi:hypothetical protein
MSPDHIEQSVKHMVAVTDLAIASMLAKDFDRAMINSGLAIIASVLVGKDQDAKTMLAQTMLKLACELDPDLVNARWQ